jgi:hypothetical protein
MKRNNLSVRFSTSVGQKLPSEREAKVVKFHLYLRENLFGVDSCQFGNMDEVPVSFDMPSSRIVNLKGAKEVSVATTGHERSDFTVVLFITSDGSKLPPIMIFKRKTVLKGCNSKDVIISDIVTLNCAVTFNLKVMTVIQSSMQHCQGWSQSKAGKQLRIEFL